MSRLRIRNITLIIMILLSLVIWKRGRESERQIPYRESFIQFPLTVGDWTGVKVPLTSHFMGLLHADDAVIVSYRNRKDGRNVVFYSAYYAHQGAEHDIHSPQNCYPGSGWEIVRSKTVDLSLGGNSAGLLRANEVLVQKGLRKEAVLYWYQERGRIFANEYKGLAYLVQDALFMHRTDGALVRVSMPVIGSDNNVFRQEIVFAKEMYGILGRFIPGRQARMENSVFNQIGSLEDRE
jgi:EpsI family protein